MLSKKFTPAILLFQKRKTKLWGGNAFTGQSGRRWKLIGDYLLYTERENTGKLWGPASHRAKRDYHRLDGLTNAQNRTQPLLWFSKGIVVSGKWRDMDSINGWKYFLFLKNVKQLRLPEQIQKYVCLKKCVIKDRNVTLDGPLKVHMAPESLFLMVNHNIVFQKLATKVYSLIWPLPSPEAEYQDPTIKVLKPRNQKPTFQLS